MSHFSIPFILACDNYSSNTSLLASVCMYDIVRNVDNQVISLLQSGYTALMIACEIGNVSIAEILIKNRANVNYRAKVRALTTIDRVCILIH